jgi:hypothetical protein
LLHASLFKENYPAEFEYPEFEGDPTVDPSKSFSSKISSLVKSKPNGGFKREVENEAASEADPIEGRDEVEFIYVKCIKLKRFIVSSFISRKYKMGAGASVNPTSDAKTVAAAISSIAPAYEGYAKTALDNGVDG